MSEELFNEYIQETTEFINNTIKKKYLLDNENIKPQIVQFLLKNLDRNGSSFCWKFNFEAIVKNIEAFGAKIESETPFTNKTLFLKGEFSNYIRSEDEEYISQLFPNYTIKQIHHAGHWLHAEQPDRFLEEVTNYF